jgi:TPR repeat protein
MKRPARVLLLLVLFTVAIGLKAEVGSLPAKDKRWALVIGVDRYDDPQIGRLQGAAADAKSLRDALVATAGFPADQVTLIATEEPKERLPTRVNILRAMTNLTRLVPRDGLLLLAFSGHGIDRNGQAYLLPSDAQIHDDASFLAETAVRLQWIHDRIRSSRVSQVLLLLDACRNDPGGRADTPNRLTEAYTRAFRFETRNDEISAFATLYATAVGERAYEYTERRQGYFTWAVVEGLRGAAANDRGEVTLSRLATYVQDTVVKRVSIDLGGGRQQRPFATIEGYRADELVLAYVPSRATSPPPALDRPSTAYMTIDPKAIELKVWEAAERLNTDAAYEEYLRQYPAGTWANLARMNRAALKRAPNELAVAEREYQQGNYAAARRSLKDASDADAQARLGSLLYLCLGGPCDLPEATRLLQNAARQGSREAEAWLALVWITRGGDYLRAVKFAREAAERGDLKGVLGMAFAYEDGAGVARDAREADRYYRTAFPGVRAGAEDGDPFLQNTLARMYRSGLGGVTRDEAKAADLFGKAADQGYATAQSNLAGMYENGEGGLAKDDKKAFEWYAKAAGNGHRYAQYVVGRFHETGRGGASKSDAKAVAAYRRAAEMGDPDALNRLAELYQFGERGLTIDYAKALDLYGQAADLGSSSAQLNLGVIHEYGRAGIKEDHAKAADYYKAASEAGNTRGTAYLGTMYESGRGVAKNEAKALELYRLASDEGDAFGQTCLGYAYSNGVLGMKKDEAKAVDLYRRAAETGYARAQNNLASMYEDGRGGLTKDLEKAVELYKKAAAQGNEKAKENLKRLGR